MTNLRLKILSLLTVLLLGIVQANAQEKSTVLISAHIIGESAYIINTIQPDYTKYELKSREDDAYIALKRELDKWILQGYVVSNSNVFRSYNFTTEVTYYLVKEEKQ